MKVRSEKISIFQLGEEQNAADSQRIFFLGSKQTPKIIKSEGFFVIFPGTPRNSQSPKRAPSPHFPARMAGISKKFFRFLQNSSIFISFQEFPTISEIMGKFPRLQAPGRH